MDPHCFFWVSTWSWCCWNISRTLYAQLCADLASRSALHTGVECYKSSMVKRILSALWILYIYLPALYVTFSLYFSHSLFQQRRSWQCLCSRSPLFCHLCRTMVSLMSCYMHCSSKTWVCHNINFYFFYFLSYAHIFCPFKTPFVCFKVSDHPKFSHARHSISLFLLNPSIFLHLLYSSLHIPAAHHTPFRPFICL